MLYLPSKKPDRYQKYVFKLHRETVNILAMLHGHLGWHIISYWFAVPSSSQPYLSLTLTSRICYQVCPAISLSRPPLSIEENPFSFFGALCARFLLGFVEAAFFPGALVSQRFSALIGV